MRAHMGMRGCLIGEEFQSKHGTKLPMQALIKAGREERLDARNIFRLASTLAESGDRIVWRNGELTTDLASTGGPSSLSTLLAPLFLSGAGLVVPKLGVPGRPAGGIDVLAQLSGYRTSFSIAKLREIIGTCGFANFLAGERFAPLDAEFFRFRQRSDGQDIPALVSASLLAKKIACGIRTVGIDVRVGSHGNFGNTYNEARDRCRVFLEAAQMAGIKMVCILTDARFVYQPFIGRGEALVALKRFFDGQADASLRNHIEQCCRMAQNVARLHGVREFDVDEREAERNFLKHIVAQGACRDAFEKKVDDVLSGHRYELIAKESGTVSVDLAGLRKVFQEVNSSKPSRGESFPDRFGVIMSARSGIYLRKGDSLATVRASPTDWKKYHTLLEKIIGCVKDSEENPIDDEVVHG